MGNTNILSVDTKMCVSVDIYFPLLSVDSSNFGHLSVANKPHRLSHVIGLAGFSKVISADIPLKCKEEKEKYSTPSHFPCNAGYCCVIFLSVISIICSKVVEAILLLRSSVHSTFQCSLMKSLPKTYKT